MNYRDYLASVTVPGDTLLEDWNWLIGSRLVLWKVTMAGDALLRDPLDGSVHFLDTMEGTIEQVATTEQDFEVAASNVANADRWFLAALVDSAFERGIRPGQDRCLSFSIPPALGGPIDADHLEPCSVAVHFSIAGQLLRQVKTLPAGTKISGIQVDGKLPGKKRAWWKFW